MMKSRVLFEIGLLFGVPMILVTQVPLEKSNFIIIPVGILIALRTLHLIRKKELIVTSRGGWIWYALAAVFGCTFYWIFRESLTLPEWLTDEEPLSFTLAHTLMQEVAFRVYLLNQLKKLGFGIFGSALLNGLAFGLVHGVLPDSLWIMLLSFGAGVVWSLIYQKNHNLAGVWFSHAVVNKFLNLVT